MFAGTAAITLSDASLKMVAGSYPTGEIMFMRAAFSMIPVWFLFRGSSFLASIRMVDRVGQIVRAMTLALPVFLYVAALPLMPFANVVALLSVMPIIAAGVSAVFLKERLSSWHGMALLLGFVGVIAITRPGADGFTWASLLPLVAAIGFGFRDMLTRKLSATENPFSILFWGVFAQAAVGIATLPFGWVFPVTIDLCWFAVAGIFLGLMQHCFIEAYRRAPVASIAPIMYMGFPIATALGYAFWNEMPDLPTIAGAFLIVSAGFVTIRRSA